MLFILVTVIGRLSHSTDNFNSTMEPLLRGHPDERPPPLERQLDNVNLNINVLISTLDGRPTFVKGHFSCGLTRGVPLYTFFEDQRITNF